MRPQACLQHLSPELLTLVISSISTPDPYDFADSEYRHSLLSLTVTCRALSEPALNRLWEKLPSFAPLVYTLPRDLWTLERLGTREKSPKDLVSRAYDHTRTFRNLRIETREGH
ncbi:hypothetical protein C8Q74DRAFT_866049 [Fomes fomentarius]|nr:hypothetical protein C8Q74DRAFT_866049 [Fomes fomentarius]